ncbi:MAG: NfeD family protein [Pyrinomonadaceae bacterium MAG19_C2-C3]|nr:NfeD family protein [Pyrinomonadaceae bacterium MAG19_C2-C3]
MLYLALLLAGAAALTVALVSFLHHQKSATTPFRVSGKTCLVETPLTPEGAVLINGELWRARTHDGTSIARGQMVRVCGADGCLLVVELVDEKSQK